MLKKGRAIPIMRDGKMSIIVTFYIGNGNPNKYIDRDPWSVIEDEPDTGDTVYIDQMISDKNQENVRLIHSLFSEVNKSIKDNFPQVRYMRWNRYKGGITRVYKRIIKPSN